MSPSGAEPQTFTQSSAVAHDNPAIPDGRMNVRMPLVRATSAARAIALPLLVMSLSACGMIKNAAIKNVAHTIAEPGDTFTGDDDPELIRRAAPFGLKLQETLLTSIPKDAQLLLATCSGYTSYAYAF